MCTNLANLTITWNGDNVSKDALHLLIFPCPQSVTVGECFSSAQKQSKEAMMVCFIWNNPSALKPKPKECHPHRLHDSHTAVTVDFDPYTKGGVELLILP